MPAVAKSDFSACISWSTETMPDTYSRLNSSLSPAAMPAPHWLSPVPGVLQVEVPFGVTVQPCEVSRLLALLGSYGSVCDGSYFVRKEFGGFSSIGPYASVPVPRSGPLTYEGWFTSSCMACRMYI